jgi:hypothetical protein
LQQFFVLAVVLFEESTCASRTPLNKPMIEDLKEFLKTIKTDPYIIKLIVYHISQLLRIKSDSDVSDLPPLYKNAAIQQELFGWNMFTRGLITQNWAFIQELYFKNNNISKLGDSWSASVSEWMIKKGREIWLTRNEKTHNTDINATSRLEKETYAQVRKLYDSAHLLSANDRELFSIPIDEFIQQPWQNLQTWVSTARPTFNACIKAQNDRLLSQQPKITEYFNVTATNEINLSQENQTNSETINLETNSLETKSNSHNNTPQQQRSRFPLPASEI